jgi:hypothetical protein
MDVLSSFGKADSRGIGQPILCAVVVVFFTTVFIRGEHIHFLLYSGFQNDKHK